MSGFHTKPSDRPLRIAQVGAGGMGKAWLRTIQANPDVELVGLIDLDHDTAVAALDEFSIKNVIVASSVTEVVEQAQVDAVINVTVPVAHLPVNVEALAAGLPVLCEKPAAPTLADAFRQAAVAENHHELLMISQSRRYFAALDAVRAELPEVGTLGTVSTEFFKAVHFPGFREEMDHVLLIDMSIHAFDCARGLIGADPVSVYCEEYNNPWSWFNGAASANAMFTFANGTRYSYTGSWTAGGVETHWNGQWRLNGEHGTVTWDGGQEVIAQQNADEQPRSVGVATDAREEIAGSLAEFVACLRSGTEPQTPARSNVQSLAMVFAAVESAESGSVVNIEQVVSAALDGAVTAEHDEQVRDILRSWQATS